MIEPNLRLQKYLEDYISWLEKLNERSLGLLGGMCAPNVSFDDPYHGVQGVDAAQVLFGRRLALGDNVHYHVHDFMWGRRESSAYIYWSFSFCEKVRKGLRRKQGKNMAVQGMSEFMFLPDGSIFSLQDFWGAHGDVNLKEYSLPFGS